MGSKTDVTFDLLNEQTFGSPRGAGEVILRLCDQNGQIVKQSGPGVEKLP